MSEPSTSSSIEGEYLDLLCWNIATEYVETEMQARREMFDNKSDKERARGVHQHAEALLEHLQVAQGIDVIKCAERYADSREMSIAPVWMTEGEVSLRFDESSMMFTVEEVDDE